MKFKRHSSSSTPSFKGLCVCVCVCSTVILLHNWSLRRVLSRRRRRRRVRSNLLLVNIFHHKSPKPTPSLFFAPPPSSDLPPFFFARPPPPPVLHYPCRSHVFIIRRAVTLCQPLFRCFSLRLFFPRYIYIHTHVPATRWRRRQIII